MSRLADIRRIVKPFIAERPELDAVDRHIVIKPLRHVFRGIVLDGTSGKGCFRPTWSVFPLCMPYTDKTRGWGFLFADHPLQCLGWHVDDPYAIQGVFDHMDWVWTKKLSAVVTLADFRAFMQREGGGFNQLYPQHPANIYIHAGEGEIDEALALCRFLLNRRDRRGDPTPLHHETVLENDILPLLEARDRPAIAALLARYERQTVELHKLTPFWQPSPFPVWPEG